MKRKILLIIITFFCLNCQETNLLVFNINSSPEELINEIKEMIVSDNYVLMNSDSLYLSTLWRKCTKEENNIPDNTIECKLDVNLVPLEKGTDVKLKVMKRSSLNSSRPDSLTYTEVGIILNDLLYKKWKDNLLTLQKKYKKE